ncbi:MAG TPA: right-handed parallel beta-helix repeat-containing protein [Verrucomicrobiae bacterium]|nr:right-handed parallel beta-helix repeat-containing protein [Verrucomicrobiae bacterium]
MISMGHFRFQILWVVATMSMGAASAPVAAGATWFVAANGLDSNAGTLAAPFATLMHAQAVAHDGDTVWLRGGTYYPTDVTRTNSPGVPWNVINNITNSGISYLAYSNELPVFDFSRVYFYPPTNRVTAFLVNADRCVFRGFDVVGVPIIYTNTSKPPQSECFRINTGNGNLFDRLRMHDGHGIGWYLTDGASNLVLNCDAYNNTGVDAYSQGNIDGFGCHGTKTNYTGNMFYGCRAWNNSDDGYDLINNKAKAVIDHCWSFDNGFFTNGAATGGNANGFKCGGYGVSGGSYPIPPPRNLIRFCLSVGNGANGFYANFHPNGLDFINNTAYRNQEDYNLICILTNTSRSYEIPGTNHYMRNNLGFTYHGTNRVVWLNTNWCDVAFNYFTLPVTVGTNDFMSLDESLLTAPRRADGSLPYIALAQLVGTSDLVDAGTNAGYAYAGAAPDLGPFEYGSQLPTLTLSRTGADVVIVAGNGPAGGTNYLLAASDLSLPLPEWSRVATNQFDLANGCGITNRIDPAAPGRFYRIELP